MLALSVTADRLQVDAHLADDVPNELPAGVAIGLYRIAQAALANTVRHAQATRATLRLDRIDGGVALEIVDDGVGFVVTGTEAGVGLLSMRERAEAFGGTLALSSAFGEGTRVRVEIPIAT